MHPVEFQRKWRGVTRTERSAAQEHFLDLCRTLGVPTPAEVDKAGTTYTFEKGATKSTGGSGWADVWYRGHFAWEYKGPDKDLGKAYDQLLRYKDHLQNPPLLVVSDLDCIIIRTNFTNTTQKTIEITLDTFAEGENQETLRRMWVDPMSLRPAETPEAVTKAAAIRFGELAKRVQERGNDPHAVAHFLMQVLFCLFAEDIGLLPNRVFSRLLDFGHQNPKAFRDETQRLLDAMGSGGSIAYEVIPYFNGGLFREVRAIELTPDEVSELRAASRLDWSQVEPVIFGTLFERSLDPAIRGKYGIQYTDRTDIERVIEPVMLAPLRRRWEQVRAEIDAQIERRDAAKTSRTRNERQADAVRILREFLDELASIRMLDPACGSGNFLFVGLVGLLDIEKEVLTYAATVMGLPMGFPSVGPEQVLGMEINSYAHELAQVVIWIGYLQWMIGNGFGWREPVLRELETIRLQDALLEERDGSVQRTEWPRADFIFGNPPFLGGNRVRQELGDDYVEKLFDVYGGKVPQFADLCCYFFEQARGAIEEDKTQRAGLLATNSIRGGVNREVLKRIKETGDIFMAWSDEPWVLNGAAVRISIIGFDDGTEADFTLNGRTVETINSDLSSTADITAANILQENLHIGFQGPSPKGAFAISSDIASQMLAMPSNVNGRRNSDVVRPVAAAVDLVRRSRGLYTIDFADLSEQEASYYEAPFEYVREHVYPTRSQNRRESYRLRWWQYAELRTGLRAALKGQERFLATPRYAKHRVFV